jgi:hypothetical protein
VPPAKRPAATPYGHNPAAGRTFRHDGIKLYYEVYGAGEPALLVHGNGGSIADLGAQIDYFRKRRVIAMDSRDQGKSADSPDAITYEKMTDDLAALLDHLKAGPVNVLGLVKTILGSLPDTPEGRRERKGDRHHESWTSTTMFQTPGRVREKRSNQ